VGKNYSSSVAPSLAKILAKSNLSDIVMLTLLCLTFLSLLDKISNMNPNEHSLGVFLQAAREGKKLTLRAAEQATGISNAYLSQLESGKIKQPSPVILHKLSDLYGVSYIDLLSLSGYPIPSKTEETNRSTLAARIGPVTEGEEEALVEYLQFLRSRKNKGKKK
jgi:transcriptional regulator with XRE-family HTH domain